MFVKKIVATCVSAVSEISIEFLIIGWIPFPFDV